MHIIYAVLLACFALIVGLVVGLFIGSQSTDLANKIDIIRREEQHVERVAALITVVNNFITQYSQSSREQFDEAMKVKDNLIKLMKRERKLMMENIKELEEVIGSDDMEDEDEEGMVGAVRTAVSTATFQENRPASNPSAQVALDLYDKIRDTRQLVADSLSKDMDPEHVTLLLNCLAVDKQIEE